MPPLNNRIHRTCNSYTRLSYSAIRQRLTDIPEWRLVKRKSTLEARWLLKDFYSAIRLLVRVESLAKKANHHPDVHLTKYRNLRLQLTTHSANGLTAVDFILAEKISRLPKELCTP